MNQPGRPTILKYGEETLTTLVKAVNLPRDGGGRLTLNVIGKAVSASRRGRS